MDLVRQAYKTQTWKFPFFIEACHVKTLAFFSQPYTKRVLNLSQYFRFPLQQTNYVGIHPLVTSLQDISNAFGKWCKSQSTMRSAQECYSDGADVCLFEMGLKTVLGQAKSLLCQPPRLCATNTIFRLLYYDQSVINPVSKKSKD